MPLQPSLPRRSPKLAPPPLNISPFERIDPAAHRPTRAQGGGASPATPANIPPAPSPVRLTRRASTSDVPRSPQDAPLCLRAHWTTPMLAEHLYEAIGNTRKGLLLWATLWTEADLGPIGPLSLSLSRQSEQTRGRQGLEVRLDGQPARFVPLLSRTTQDAHLAQVGQALLEAPWREPTSFAGAIGLLLHEPELVEAWCRHAQTMGADAWRRLASAAGKAAQKAARPPKREDAESFLQHVARQCRNAAVAAEKSEAARAQASSMPSPTAVPLASPTVQSEALAGPAAGPLQSPAPAAPPAVSLESLAQQWAAAESPPAQACALDALLAALGAPPASHAAYAAAVADALRAAGTCDADAGWRLHAALCERHARPSLQTVARSLLTLPAPQQDGALASAAQALQDAAHAPKVARRLASEAPAALDAFAKNPALHWPTVAISALQDRAALLRRIALRPTDDHAFRQEVRAQMRAALDQQPPYETCSAQLLAALEHAAALPESCGITDVEFTVWAAELDAYAPHGAGLHKPLALLLEQHIDALPQLSCSSPAMQNAAAQALTSLRVEQVRTLRQATRGGGRAASCPAYVFERALVEIERKTGSALSLLLALRRLTETVCENGEAGAQQMHESADSILGGLRTLYKKFKQDPLPAVQLPTLTEWLVDLIGDIGKTAEYNGLRPTREEMAQVVRDRQWDLPACTAALPAGPIPLGERGDQLYQGCLGMLTRAHLHLLGVIDSEGIPTHIAKWATVPAIRDATLLSAISGLRFAPRVAHPRATPRFLCAEPRESTSSQGDEASARIHHRHWVHALMQGPLGPRGDDCVAQDAWYRLAPRIFSLCLSDATQTFVTGEAAVLELSRQLQRLSASELHEVAAGLRGAFVTGDNAAYFRVPTDLISALEPSATFCREHLLPAVVAFCRVAPRPLAAYIAERFLIASQLEEHAERHQSECGKPEAAMQRLACALGPELMQASILPSSLGASASIEQQQQALSRRFLLLFAYTFRHDDGQVSLRRLCSAFIELADGEPGQRRQNTVANTIGTAFTLHLQRRVSLAEDFQTEAKEHLLDLAALLADSPRQTLAAQVRGGVIDAFEQAAAAYKQSSRLVWLAQAARKALAKDASAQLHAHRKRLAQQRALAEVVAPFGLESVSTRVSRLADSVSDDWYLDDAIDRMRPSLLRLLGEDGVEQALHERLSALGPQTPTESRRGLVQLLALCRSANQAQPASHRVPLPH